MRRREFITLLGGGAATSWPIEARARSSRRLRWLFVSSRSFDGSAGPAAALSKGLSETGYVEGQNVIVEYHWLSGRYDRLPSLMADLVRPSRRRYRYDWRSCHACGQSCDRDDPDRL